MFNVYSFYKATGDWIHEFTSLVQCNDSAEGQEEASMTDTVFRWLAMPWELFFAMVPSSSYCGSWICFNACLFFIALVTAVIADLSEHFGCELGIPDVVTAITFVALGTSKQDLFAFKMASTEDETAGTGEILM